MRIYDSIKKKRNGCKLNEEEIREIIKAYTKGKIPDYQMSALLMAIYFQGLDNLEMTTWTDAMLNSGKVMDLSKISAPKVDKHSTGGVGDKVSIPLAPLAAACGVVVPMISGRGLGHTGGTLDKLESIPGFRTDLNFNEFLNTLNMAGASLMGQTSWLAPADRKLYALRDVTATVESIPLIASSIMSKKLAEGIDGLVLDVKSGTGAFMKKLTDARKLAETLVSIGKGKSVKTVAILTDMNQPLGNCIGNSLEIIESIDVLKGRGPDDLKTLVVLFGAWMIFTGGLVSTVEEGSEKIQKAVDSGKGLEIFRRIIELHHGDPFVVDDVTRMPRACHIDNLLSTQDGFVRFLDAEAIGISAMLLGAGREKVDSIIDPAVGLILKKKIGDRVTKGEPLLEIHYNSDKNLQKAKEMLLNSYGFSKKPVKAEPLIKEIIL
jgi:pyrimidine-nucleoside phosphorylase